ncbi:MAG: TatD family hydrolase [Bacteroidales bacterium]|nr:TatD family hydrolase [Bacteroidales bacterium]MDD4683810.1 TatD family hydrolase [Bacteroidales bacterium]
MNFIDTHSHLYAQEFKEDISQTILRAKEANVNKILLPNIDIASIEPMLELCKLDDCFHPMLGLHPTSVDNTYLDQLREIELLLDKVNICAIGEIGIDLYWDKTFIEEQTIAFERQVHWAMDRNLPLVIHVRKGFEEVFQSIERLKKEIKGCDKSLKGVFHCFSGDLNQAKKVIEMGFKIGIGGVLTFKNAKLADIVREIDIEHILLETDAPYLAPSPFRGKRNESSYIPIIAEKISEIKNIRIEEVASITTNSAQKLFSI